MRWQPLADLESRASLALVVELDSESRCERLDALLQLAGYVHDALKQFAVCDVCEVDVDVNAKVWLVGRDLRPPLIAAGTHVLERRWTVSWFRWCRSIERGRTSWVVGFVRRLPPRHDV